MGILIQNGTVVTALDSMDADILCVDGKIAAIGVDLEASTDDEIVDAAGHYVFPGGVDPHVHMEIPLSGTVSADDFESGTAAGVGRLDLHQFVDLTSTRAAKIFGMYPRKGAIAVGADADLVVWDPEATATICAKTHRQRVDRNVFEGFELKGMPTVVIVAGRVQFREGDLKVEKGAGRFVPRGVG
jgi:dihydroorotase-like cyclic amidohydrolase